MGLFNRWSINAVFIFATIIYIAGLNTDVLEVDSAQYASISEEMNRTGSYLEVYHNGNDYLDKPPILFWVNATMFKIFGIHNWSFKLGSLLFSLIGIISTYKLGFLLYNKRIGFIAGVMLGSSQAYFLFNADVRTDAILTSAVIFSVWQIIAHIYTRKWKNLIFGFIGIGVAMMAKGPIGIVVPALALGSYLIGRQQFKAIFRWQWLVGLAITALVILPMSYGLYTQFDAHPEKELRFISDAGNTVRDSVSGLRFYFWEQSFGRITGENVWKDNSGPFFFFGIFTYSFLPWALLAFLAVFWRLFNAVKDLITTDKKQEWLTLGGFVLPFLAFSMSSYKLDHYLYVTFPFVAIITSEYVIRIIFEKPKWWVNILISIQTLVIAVSLAFGALILIYVFPTSNVFIWLGYLILFALTVIMYFNKHIIYKVVLASVFASLAANWVLNFKFFPVLTKKYQSGHKMVNYIEKESIDKDHVYISADRFRFQYNFYGQYQFNLVNVSQIKSLDLHQVYIYLKKEDLDLLEKQGLKYQVEQEYQTFHVTMLTPEFLNPATREQTLNTDYLVLVL